MENMPDKKPMKMDDIMELIAGLARSTGSYGRMLEELQTIKEYNPECWNAIAEDWENHEFMDPVEFIMYIEG